MSHKYKYFGIEDLDLDLDFLIVLLSAERDLLPPDRRSEESVLLPVLLPEEIDFLLVSRVSKNKVNMNYPKCKYAD